MVSDELLVFRGVRWPKLVWIWFEMKAVWNKRASYRQYWTRRVFSNGWRERPCFMWFHLM